MFSHGILKRILSKTDRAGSGLYFIVFLPPIKSPANKTFIIFVFVLTQIPSTTGAEDGKIVSLRGPTVR
jgi:hypothetical protein